MKIKKVNNITILIGQSLTVAVINMTRIVVNGDTHLINTRIVNDSKVGYNTLLSDELASGGNEELLLSVTGVIVDCFIPENRLFADCLTYLNNRLSVGLTDKSTGVIYTNEPVKFPNTQLIRPSQGLSLLTHQFITGDNIKQTSEHYGISRQTYYNAIK